MTKDSGKVFALQSETGKVVWQNTLALGIEYLGKHGNHLIVRGQFSLAAINLQSGKTSWHTKVPERSIGRSQMIGSSIYLASTTEITEFDAITGAVKGSTQWHQSIGQPLSYLIDKNSIYVISDSPSKGGGIAVSEPLNPNAVPANKSLSSNIKRQWTLMRNDAKIIRAPHDSPLTNHAFILSEGLLE